MVLKSVPDSRWPWLPAEWYARRCLGLHLRRPHTTGDVRRCPHPGFLPGSPRRCREGSWTQWIFRSEQPIADSCFSPSLRCGVTMQSNQAKQGLLLAGQQKQGVCW